MILAVIQARAGGTRLPGKVLELIEGKPLIEHVVNRVKASELLNAICLAIPDTFGNDTLAAHSESLGVPVYRGSEYDVLSRFYWAVEMFPDADVIVRITADDPFKDPKLIDYAIQGFLTAWAEPDEQAGSPQYLHLGGSTWPLGCDVEVFTRDALALTFTNAGDAYDREHVTPWMRGQFPPWVLKNPDSYGQGKRWTIDTAEDLNYARYAYEMLYAANPLFGFEELKGEGL